jgi:hypothetical protein
MKYTQQQIKTKKNKNTTIDSKCLERKSSHKIQTTTTKSITSIRCSQKPHNNAYFFSTFFFSRNCKRKEKKNKRKQKRATK